MKSLVLDIETTGLNPLTDKITCIGVKEFGLNTYNSFSTMYDDDEGIILDTFWRIAAGFDKLVGWNINGFDWKFLKIRSLIKGVKIPKYFTKKDRIDLMIILKTDRWQKLDTYAKLLLDRRKSTENPIELFRNKEMGKLSLFNKNDVELTFDIFRQCVECGLIQDE